MKILLFGKNGQVGWELQRALAPLGDLTAVDSGEVGGDLTERDAVVSMIRTVAPDLIINAAAHTAVDKAESEPELAHAINASGPELLAREAKALGAWLVHYSTDYVFDGSGSTARTETDAVAPINIYGQTKLDGERAIASSGCKFLLFRTSWVYAARGQNFPRTMLRLAQEKDRLTVIDDQIGAPTGADLLADVTAHALRAALRKPELTGLYHLAAGGETSWYEYAKFVIQFASEAGLRVKVTEQAVEPVLSEAFKTPANRPKNSRLNTEKLCRTFELRLPNWQVGVARMLTETKDLWL